MRSFLALEIPEETGEYLRTCIGRLAKRTADVKWVRNEGIHITVKFLGEIEESLARRMEPLLLPVGGLIAPIRARLGALDAFPSLRSARVIVVRLKEGGEKMEMVFSEVEERLAAIGIEKEKRGFTPHITLGRRRTPKPFPNGDPMPIDKRNLRGRQVLFQSTLTPGGKLSTPRYGR